VGLFDRFKKKDIGYIVYKDGVVAKSKEDPSFREKGVQGNKSSQNWDRFFGLQAPNPDEIGISTYKDMLRDSEVRTGYNFIRNCILSRSWKVSYPEKSREKNKDTTEILEFLRFAFTNLDENAQFERAVGRLLSAIPFGFSVVEIVYKLIEEGRFKGKIGIKKLKDLDPETIEFVTNKYGDIEKILQRADPNAFEEKPIVLPLDRTIVYTIDEEFGNHYGTSRLRSIYRNWFVKKTVIKFWNVALERFGTPILIGTVPNKNDIDRMLELLDNVQGRSSIAKTAGWEIEALETGIGRSSGGDFGAAIDYHNNQILKGLLVPPMLIAGKGGGGSYALSNTQFGIYQTMLKNLEVDLSNMIEERVIKPLVIYNYGVQDLYPQFVWEPMTKEDLLNLSKAFALLVKNGIVGWDEQWMRDAMGVPHRDVAEITRDLVTEPGKEKVPPPIPEIRVKQTRVQEGGGSQQVKTGKTPTTGGKKAGAKGGVKTPV
jgi:phage gp29-like protein